MDGDASVHFRFIKLAFCPPTKLKLKPPVNKTGVHTGEFQVSFYAPFRHDTADCFSIWSLWG
jgi:hypothetical protein